MYKCKVFCYIITVYIVVLAGCASPSLNALEVISKNQFVLNGKLGKLWLEKQ